MSTIIAIDHQFMYEKLKEAEQEDASSVDSNDMNIVSFTSQLCASTSEENAEKCVDKKGSRKSSTFIEGQARTPTCCRNGEECKVAGNCVCNPPKPTDPTDEKPTSSRETYDVFLGGSCGTTVWRRQSVIPFLKKRGITYYDPQRSCWSENMIYEESIAKESSSLFLFVIDPATVNATSFLEIAYFAARKSPKLVVVFLGKTEWAEKAHPDDLPDRNRTCQLLDRILESHSVPMLHTIPDALEFIEEEMIGRQSFREAMKSNKSRVPYLQIRGRRIAHNVRNVAETTFKTCRTYATKTVLTGMADAVALITASFVFPTIPLLYLLVPIIFINILIFAVVSRVRNLRRRYPRMIADSSAVLYNSTPAIPSPRMTITTTSVNETISAVSKVRRRSNQNFEKLMEEDGSSSFVIPQSFIKKQEPKINIDCSVIELCSSALDDNSWVQELAAPVLDGKGTPYSYALAMPNFNIDTRMNCLRTWLHHHKKFFYYIPTTQTFLSGMVEIAYILGHTNWEGTVCVPPTSQFLECPEENNGDEIEQTRAARRRRNDCYQIAFCYLKDMAKRRQCRVYTDIQTAIKELVEPKMNAI
ncbi:unnamed protein product [Caenorhabditis angaria]|uniref:Uncharacterized protein n=1 Tax=Caenorhabditis angaria TaxID=860376 RepID=A0A9P1NB06_9PELO|nr:unnamed protein product [Caenorhabditis angaria]